jgi:hypothetical protein
MVQEMTWLKQYALYLKAGAVIALLGLLTWGAVSAYGWAYNNGRQSAELACSASKVALAEAAMADLQAARAKEQAAAKRVDQAAKQYEQDKLDAQTAHDRLVAELRAGNKRLHDRWQASVATGELSSAAERAARADAAERERQDSAARIIAAADRCDAQVKGLQDVVKADRGE